MPLRAAIAAMMRLVVRMLDHVGSERRKLFARLTYPGVSFGKGSIMFRGSEIRAYDAGIPVEDQGRTSAPVLIGENCWIGAKVTITKGVTIPPASVIGANSVVTRSLSGGRVYAGAPARMLR